MNKKFVFILALVGLLTLGIVLAASAVSGAAFTTFNAHVDGAGKDVCKNSAINCNIYGAKEYVWLNGGPTANGLGPDGEYFFAVLEPGGQPNPNDQGAVADKNLSDDYDCYQNRIFTVFEGEVSAYAGNYDCSSEGYAGYAPFRHWLDDGVNGPKPNWDPPYIRLFPYSDTTNPGGVYILAICSLDEGYPVEPRDCKYDAFKVKKGKIDISFYLSGWKVEDVYADGFDAGDPGLEGWKIIIDGTGPDGQPLYAEVFTDENGFWEYFSPVYTFTGQDKPQEVNLTVCEELQPGWTQSFPGGDGCHPVSFPPGGFDSFENLNFANWRPVSVTACKDRQNYDGSTTPVAGWLVSLTTGGTTPPTIVDTQPTGANGCYTWYPLDPGIVYDVHEEEKAGWLALGPVDYVFEKAKSGKGYSHTFVNQPLEGCTPGFWQGGNDFGTAGGKWYWNVFPDDDWAGTGDQPFYWGTGFCSFFGGCLNTGDMWYYINPDMWTVNDEFHRAARSLTAAYLNASWGIGYAYTTAELEAMWADAITAGGDWDLASLHTELDAANNAYYRPEPPPHCPIPASQN